MSPMDPTGGGDIGLISDPRSRGAAPAPFMGPVISFVLSRRRARRKENERPVKH